MYRRQLLASAVVAGIGATAGCLDADHATVQRLVLLNAREEPVTTELRIERDGADEPVYEGSYEIGPGLDGVPVDCVWPDEPLRVSARPDDLEEWHTLTTDDGEGCLIVYAETHDDGVSFFTASEECPVRSADCHADDGG